MSNEHITNQNEKDRNIWLEGIMGVVVGDALGCPVQFLSREEIANRDRGPVVGMEAGGTMGMPEGSWSDDSSLTLATVDSLRYLKMVDLEDIMTGFILWLEDGEYTPYGEAFDIGRTCFKAIKKFEIEKDTKSCGGRTEKSNGNGSLMRIMPVCLFAYENKKSDREAIKMIHDIGGLTHNHLRSQIACGLYYFCTKSILDGHGPLIEVLQKGLDDGFAFYDSDSKNKKELAYYNRLRNLEEFAKTKENEIRSSGYVVDSLEAAIWSIINTNNLKEGLLKAVNLGRDTDSVAAIAGGLAALFYGYKSIPSEWLGVIKRREWIEELCKYNY